MVALLLCVFPCLLVSRSSKNVNSVEVLHLQLLFRAHMIQHLQVTQFKDRRHAKTLCAHPPTNLLVLFCLFFFVKEIVLQIVTVFVVVVFFSFSCRCFSCRYCSCFPSVRRVPLLFLLLFRLLLLFSSCFVLFFLLLLLYPLVPDVSILAEILIFCP